MGSTAPIDRYWIVYLIYITHGIGIMMPFNMLLNAHEYFVNHKLAMNMTSDAANGRLNNYRTNFSSYMGIASKLPALLAIFVHMFATHAICSSLSRRIMVSLVLQVIVFIVTIGMSVADTQSIPETFFWLTIWSTVVLNLANGVYQSCVYGTAAQMPAVYTNAVSLGLNLSGILVAVANIVSVSVAPDPQRMAIIYFSTGVVILVLCFVCEIYLNFSEFYIYYRDYVNPVDSDIPDDKPSTDNNSDNCVNSCLKSDKVYTLTKTWPQLVDILIVYFVNFSIYPSVLINIESTDRVFGSATNRYFKPVFVFLTYSTLSSLGSLTAQYIPVPARENTLAFTACTPLLIPVYLFMNYLPKTRTLPVLFRNDWLYLSLNMFLGWSGGHLTCLAIMRAPRVLSKRYSGLASMETTFTILLGIISGLSFSLVFPHIV